MHFTRSVEFIEFRGGFELFLSNSFFSTTNQLELKPNSLFFQIYSILIPKQIWYDILFSIIKEKKTHLEGTKFRSWNSHLKSLIFTLRPWMPLMLETVVVQCSIINFIIVLLYYSLWVDVEQIVNKWFFPQSSCECILYNCMNCFSSASYHMTMISRFLK